MDEGGQAQIGEGSVLLRMATGKMNQDRELKANLGLVVRGEVVALKGFVERLDELVSAAPEVQLVHRHVSASKLWTKEGGEMNEGPRDR